MEEKRDLRSMDLEEMTALCQELGEPKFRAGQLFDWVHQKGAASFQEMTNLSKALRQKLEETCTLTTLAIVRRLESKLDETVKYLYRLPDGESVETVLMKYEYGYSLCVSCQVGCKMGCAFCASTKAGFVRNLTPGEMLEQVYRTQADRGVKVGHLVLMGIGEPLDNYDTVLKFLALLHHPKGQNLSMRNISLSTCGLVPRIKQLAQEKLGLTLSVSLHAADNETRSRIMPVNLRYPIEELLTACKEYTQLTSRRISFEYALIAGENDSPEQAKKLAKLLKGQLCHVNLIPVNYVKEAGFQPALPGRVRQFQSLLMEHGINATVRRTLGSDIAAACGQLRRENS